VQTRPDEWEQPNIDLTGYIQAVNALKLSRPVLREEGSWRTVTSYSGPTIVLEKTCPSDRIAVLVNKDWHHPQEVSLWGMPRLGKTLRRIDERGKVSEEPLHDTVRLAPTEIALVD